MKWILYNKQMTWVQKVPMEIFLLNICQTLLKSPELKVMILSPRFAKAFRALLNRITKAPQVIDPHNIRLQ